MDNNTKNLKNENDEELKSYIDILKEAKKEFPNLTLPSMGILDNEKKIDINIKDYLIKNNQ